MFYIERDNNQYRVELVDTSKLDALNSGQMVEELTTLFNEPGLLLVLNIAAIRVIDKAGFNALITLDNRARESGGRLKLCNVNEEVAKLIILQDLEGKFSVCSCQNSEEKLLLVLE